MKPNLDFSRGRATARYSEIGGGPALDVTEFGANGCAFS